MNSSKKRYQQTQRHTPGYLGSTFLRPEGGGDRDFVTIVRFASYENMMQWEHSTTGSALINRADAMSELPGHDQSIRGIVPVV